MPRHLNLRQIEAFKAVIECGGVSHGASLLNISQPAMSKLIAHLEFDTGLQLFDRVRGRLAPTEHAMRLYEEIGRIFAGVRQVENAVEAIRREEQGRLAIGVMPALSGSFIQRATTAFLEDHPNVFVSVESLRSLWTVERLVSRKLDVGLVAADIDNPYVTREPLLSNAMVCVMAPGHPLAAKPFISPADLDQQPFVAFNAEADIGELVRRALETSGTTPKVVLVSNVAPTVCEFVAAGLGISLIHPLSLSGFEDRLIARRFIPDLNYTFQLCRSADSRNAQLVEAFGEKVRTVARQISESMWEPVKVLP